MDGANDHHHHMAADDENIPLQGNGVLEDANVASLPSSPTAAFADVTVELPYVTPSCSLAIQTKRALLVRNALVASNVIACSAASLVGVVQENVREGGQRVEMDEYIEMVRLLPEIRGTAAFHPLEETLQRIYKSFQAADKLDLTKLGIGSLLLVGGNAQTKVSAAMQLAVATVNQDTSRDILSKETIESALLCLLLGVSAVFDEADAEKEQLEASASILATSVNATVNRMWTANDMEEDEEIPAEFAWQWIEERMKAKFLAWIKLVDHTKWPTTKRLTSPPSSPRRQQTADGLPNHGKSAPLSESPTTEGEGDEDVIPPALSFRFSGVDGGVLMIGQPEAEVLFALLTQSAFTKVHAQTMYDTFVQHTGDGLLEEETFLEAIEELVSMTNETQLMQDSDFLDDMLHIFRCFLPENCAKVDAFEIAAGFSLFAWGSKSDKLASSFHYFDADSKGFLNRQQLWRFLRSVLIALLYLSPPYDNIIQRYGSIADLVDTGEQEIMENIMDGMCDRGSGDGSGEDEDDEQHSGRQRARTTSEARLGVYTFEEFGLWYNSGGFKGMSWLELLDLRKWMFVSNKFQLDALDTEPVDPILASTNYYTAQNIHVDVDSGNSMDHGDVHRLAFPDAIEEDEDEDGDNDDDDDDERKRGFPHSHSSYSSATTGPSRNPSGINSSMPAILLKNEIVLEFELAFDTDDDSTVEIPLTTLSFDNGDLIQYYELQRVMKLHEIELFQVYDAFEPYMESATTAWMEKSTFDACIMQLLPADIAHGVASSFGVHPNTRVPPPSIGRAKDSKMVADTLSRLFFAFNRGGTGKIDLMEFLAAFTLFCAGSKSEKLAFSYRLFDADRDGALTRREMWKYLRSFLTMLLALGNGSELSAEAIASVADATAIAIADAIFKDTNKTFSTREPPSYPRLSHRFSIDTPESADTVVASRNTLRRGQYYHRGSLPNVNTLSVGGAGVSGAGPGAGSAFVRGGIVTFEEFAKWYTTNGYNIIAWIELLDAKKWPQVNDEVAEAILRYISRQQRALAEAALRGSATGPDSSSAYDTASSNGSQGHARGRTSSMDAEYSQEDNTPLNTTELLTDQGDNQYVGKSATETARPSMRDVDRLIVEPTSATSSVRDLSSVALQFKLTSYDNATLRIRLKDVAIIYTIAERMGFRAMVCEALLLMFNQYGAGRSLTKVGFLKTMRELVPRDALSNEDQEFLSFHLLRIFALFEAESVLDDDDEDEDGEAENDGSQNGSTTQDVRKTSSVEKLQLIAGMSVFCGGSKSAKLGVLFKLFDTHGDGYVSRRHLFELLKSILVVLFAFSSYNASKAHTNDTSINTWSINSAAEKAAGAVISKLFCEAKCRHPDAITLAEFATWYANGGYMDCPWLELLDLSKWPAKEAFEASKKEKPLIYAFDMLEEGSLLQYNESDISTYLYMLRSTKLSEISVSKLYDALLAYATPSAEEARKMSRAQQSRAAGGTGGIQDYSYLAVEEDEGAYLVLSRSNFYECIRSLVPKDEMAEKAQQTSSKLLSRLFNVFDRTRCGRVNALELACGLSILGKGSKSQKLSMAFEFITKMRQQRHRTLSNYGSMNVGGGGFNGGGFGGAMSGINSIATGGGAMGWVTSARGAMSTTSGLRRSMMQNESNALPHSVLFIYLRSFLLALMALSDGTYRLGLEKMYAEADDFIEEAMGDLMTEVAANGNNVGGGGGYAGYGTARSRARVTFEQFGEWYNSGGCEQVSWIELLDVNKWEQQQEFQENEATLSRTATSKRSMTSQRGHVASTRLVEPVRTSPKPRTTQKKVIRQSDIVSSSYQPRSVRSRERNKQQQKPLSTHRESTGAISLSSDGPIMVFAISDQAAELQFFHDDVNRLKQFLKETKLHNGAPRLLTSGLLTALQVAAHSTMQEVSRGAFIAAVQTICSGGLSEESVDLLHCVADVFVKEPASTTTSTANGHAIASTTTEDEDEQFANEPIEVASILCGLFVVSDGSLLDKLTCAVRLFDPSPAAIGSAHHEVETTTLAILKKALVCFLMAFYGMSSSHSGEIVRYSAQLGVDDVLRAFTSSTPSEDGDGDNDGTSTTIAESPLDLTTVVSLEGFNDWFSDTGYHAHPWLELTELEHWPAPIDIRGSLDN